MVECSLIIITPGSGCPLATSRIPSRAGELLCDRRSGGLGATGWESSPMILVTNDPRTARRVSVARPGPGEALIIMAIFYTGVHSRHGVGLIPGPRRGRGTLAEARGPGNATGGGVSGCGLRRFRRF